MRLSERTARLAVVMIIVIGCAIMMSMIVYAQDRVIAQVQQTPMPTLDWSADAQRIGLVTALIIAVGVLWKALSSVQKDYVTALLTATKSTTDALSATAASNAELRHIIEESVAAKRELAESINLLRVGLGELPCVVASDNGLQGTTHIRMKG